MSLDLQNAFNTGYFYQMMGNYAYMKTYYDKIAGHHTINTIHAIHINHIKHTIIAMFFLGQYYQYIARDYENMKKYYILTICLGYCPSMFFLAKYYELKKDYPSMKKYYKMAISNNNISAMYHLGRYYHHVEKDYVNMKKYYEMAICSRNQKT